MEPKKKKPIIKKWWFWVIVVFVLLIIMGNLGKGGKESTQDKTSTDNTAEEQISNAATDETTAASDVVEDKKEAYEVGEGLVKTWQNSLGTTWVSVAVPVKNTGNVNLYLSSGTIDVEDASGSLVKTLKMVNVYPQVLQPGETAYYYDETTVDGDLPSEGLKTIPHVDVKKAKVDCIRYATSELSAKDTAYSGAKITGRVENTSDNAESMVYVVANIFDASGNLLAQQFTILDNELQPGEKIGFETSNMGYEFSVSDIADYEVFAFPHQYQF